MTAPLALALAAALFTTAPQEPTLKVGSPAPALAIEKWVKGEPVAGFEKGKVYVVEFWATWCGPCIASMPHLSELQREFKDKGVTFIGVSSEDSRGNSLEKVEAMVKEKGDVMGYTVAWDQGRATSDAFMKAAAQRGIPCSFLVDGNGKIAYIGLPMFLDLPLEALAAGTWDNEKGNAAVADAKLALNGIYAAFQNDKKGVSAKIAEFETKYPQLTHAVESLKFDALLFAGEFPAAYAYGKKLVDEAIAKKNSAELNAIAWKIVDPEMAWGTLDLDLALRAAEKAVAIDPDPAIIDTLARVHFLKGDVKKAIEHQTKAVELATGAMKESLQKALDEYKAKAAQ